MVCGNRPGPGRVCGGRRRPSHRPTKHRWPARPNRGRSPARPSVAQTSGDGVLVDQRQIPASSARQRFNARHSTSNRHRNRKSLLRHRSQRNKRAPQPPRLRPAHRRLGNPPSHEIGSTHPRTAIWALAVSQGEMIPDTMRAHCNRSAFAAARTSSRKAYRDHSSSLVIRRRNFANPVSVTKCRCESTYGSLESPGSAGSEAL